MKNKKSSPFPLQKYLANFFKDWEEYFKNHKLKLIKKSFFKKIYIIPFDKAIITFNLFFILIIFMIALSFNPYYFFDDSNTLNISSQSLKSILQILSYEQNFLAYYFITHFIINIFQSIKFVILFNFLIWIVSILIFYKLTETYTNNFKWKQLYLSLFILASSASFYAYHTRMYGVIILLSILYFYALNSYLISQKLKWLILQLITFLGFSIIHPSSIFILPIISLITIFVTIKKNHIILTLLTALSSFILIVSQLLQKNNLINIYLGSGIDYLSGAGNIFYNFFIQVLFYPDYLVITPLSLLFFILFLFIGYKSIFKHKIEWTVTKIIPILLTSFLIILAILGTTNLHPRHLIFFIIPIILSLIISLETFKKPQKYILGLTFLIFFLGFNIQNMITHFKIHSLANTLCESVEKIEKSTIISDYYTYNLIKKCTSKNNEIIMLGINSLNTKGLQDKDILIHQAKLGGSAHLSMQRKGMYKNLLMGIKDYLDSQPSSKKIYYARTIQNDPKIFAEELKIFEKYDFYDFKESSLFIFKKK